MSWTRLCPSTRTDYPTGVGLTACITTQFPATLTTAAYSAVLVRALTTGNP